MDYAVATFESFGDLLGLVHVRLYESGALRDVRLESGAEVVKAFNTVFAQVLADGPDFGKGQTVSVFVASDSERAKQSATALAQSIGFATVDAGGLKNARYLEPLAGFNIYLGYGAGLGTSIAPVWIKRA